MDRTITLYGADWCADCRRAKAWLRRNEVAFTEVDVSVDEVARQRAIGLADGRRNIPVLVLADGTVLIEPTDTELAEAVKTS